MSSTAQQAIDQSIAEDSIVHLDYDAATAAGLLVECEDYVENGAVTEYWGGDDEPGSDTSAWRVHMATGPTDAQINTLGREAAEAGDEAQSALCASALAGDHTARTECARVIADAAAQA